MAPGIAAAFAVAGHDVVLWARRPDAADRALERARAAAAFLVEHELAAAPGPDALAASSELASIADAGVVVEAIAEQLPAKHELLAAVERVVAPETLVATNTSGLRVTDVAAPLGRPERVVAMHFWNPAHLMPLVEVGGGERTAAEHVDAAYELARSIGKQPVRVEQEVLGFLGTRLQQAVVREAIGLVERGIASPEDVDLAVRTSFGIRFPVTGPLESADISGLDVIEAIHDYLLPDLDRSTEPQTALRERVAAGALGVKSGRGFHDWSARDPQELIRRRDEELVRRLRLDR
jgi:3-hydroxyacyl-CoA dehydrogenase